MIILYEVGIIIDLNEAQATKRTTNTLSSDGEQIHSRRTMFTTKARSNFSCFSFLNPANTGSRVWLASRFLNFWASVVDCEYFGPQPLWPDSMSGSIKVKEVNDRYSRANAVQPGSLLICGHKGPFGQPTSFQTQNNVCSCTANRTIMPEFGSTFPWVEDALISDTSAAWKVNALLYVWVSLIHLVLLKKKMYVKMYSAISWAGFAITPKCFPL